MQLRDHDQVQELGRLFRGENAPTSTDHTDLSPTQIVQEGGC